MSDECCEINVIETGGVKYLSTESGEGKDNKNDNKTSNWVGNRKETKRWCDE